VLVDSEEEREGQRWQTRTRSYRDRVLDIARASTRYSGDEVRSATRELIVYGVGEPPEELVVIMNQAPSSIRVTRHEAPFTLAELSAEVRRLLAEHRDRLTGGGPQQRGTGVQFTTDDDTLLEAADPQTVLGALFPVEIERGGPYEWA
jgi:hypothetical protein